MDPLEITPLAEDLEAQLWDELQAARADLKQVQARLCKTTDARWDRLHDANEALAQIAEAEEAWGRHINSTRDETQ